MTTCPWWPIGEWLNVPNPGPEADAHETVEQTACETPTDAADAERSDLNPNEAELQAGPTRQTVAQADAGEFDPAVLPRWTRG